MSDGPKVRVIRSGKDIYVCVEDLRGLLNRMSSGHEQEFFNEIAAMLYVGFQRGDSTERLLTVLIGAFLVRAAGLDGELPRVVESN